MSDEIIKNLLEALEVSPENVPLRLQVAGMLMAEKKYEEATRQYQDVLQRSYGNVKAQAGLAAGYYYQQKYSAAIIVYEQMQNDMTTADQVLYIKCLIKEDSMEQALGNYQQVLALHPGFTDEEIDSHLRMPSASNSMGDDLDFLDDEEYLMEKPSLRFKDVGGMEKVKEEISIKIIQPLKNPELYKAFGKKSGGFGNECFTTAGRTVQ